MIGSVKWVRQLEEKPHPHERKVTVCGLDYAYKSWGAYDAPPILAFHGWLDNANTFDVIAPAVAKHYRLLSFDFMGHGRSAHLPKWRYYHYADLLSDAAEILDLWAEFEPVVLLGHSLGGAIVTCLAAMYPEKVRAVVTIDALGPLVGPLETLTEKMAEAALSRSRWHQRPARVLPSMEKAVDARLMGQWPITREAARILCERGTQSVDGGYVWSADPRWKTPSVLRLCEEQVQAILSKVQCPLFLAVAEKGLLEQMPGYEARKACIPDLRLQYFPGGHHLHMEGAADAFADWMLAGIGT